LPRSARAAALAFLFQPLLQDVFALTRVRQAHARLGYAPRDSLPHLVNH
jgi:hypothetical protein